jgi:hypothetical protein
MLPRGHGKEPRNTFLVVMTTTIFIVIYLLSFYSTFFLYFLEMATKFCKTLIQHTSTSAVNNLVRIFPCFICSAAFLFFLLQMVEESAPTWFGIVEPRNTSMSIFDSNICPCKWGKAGNNSESCI